MKKFLITFLMILAVVSFVGAQEIEDIAVDPNCKFSTDPAIGVWMSIDDDGVTPTGYWVLFLEGEKLFGKMIYAIGEPVDMKLVELKTKPYKDYPTQDNLQEFPLLDTILMYNMAYKSEGSWWKGRIIDPEDGKLYYVKVDLKGDKMQMKGSIDKRGFIGRSQTWVKSSMEKALAAKANLE